MAWRYKHLIPISLNHILMHLSGNKVEIDLVFVVFLWKFALISLFEIRLMQGFSEVCVPTAFRCGDPRRA